MSYQIADFIAQLHLITGDFPAVSTKAAELNAIAAALATDPTRHSAELETPPAAVRPSLATNTPYTNQVLRLVNRGKGGNLLPLDMGNAITAELSKLFAPVNTSPPVISGTGTVGFTLTSTVGNWTYVPTSYAYQWTRNSTPIGLNGQGATYTLVAADSGTNCMLRLTATNAAGSTTISSNAIAVA
jgi:hypothetical protein